MSSAHPATKQSTPSKVLILLSSVEPGTSPKHFVQVYSVCSTVFPTVHISTANGLPPIWSTKNTPHTTTHMDDATSKWIADKKNILSNPLSLEDLDPAIENYSGLVVPDADGFYFEHCCQKIHSFMEYFLKFKKPICMIGSGTAVLFSTEPKTGDMWIFRKFALTAPSNVSLIQSDQYLTNRSIEDFISDMYGRYSTGKSESLHVVIDDHIVTAQANTSTLIAIQTFILLCNR
ncbi:Glutamine amidotransferase-like class 1 domain-containing protein 1 [Batrachochytrium dendrobatidis]|nr:Glutamine amidotransferase-like class 1 domain-containing protein 1 [Batrachochytrium dendrobatidis]